MNFKQDHIYFFVMSPSFIAKTESADGTTEHSSKPDCNNERKHDETKHCMRGHLRNVPFFFCELFERKDKRYNSYVGANQRM